MSLEDAKTFLSKHTIIEVKASRDLAREAFLLCRGIGLKVENCVYCPSDIGYAYKLLNNIVNNKNINQMSKFKYELKRGKTYRKMGSATKYNEVNPIPDGIAAELIKANPKLAANILVSIDLKGAADKTTKEQGPTKAELSAKLKDLSGQDVNKKLTIAQLQEAIATEEEAIAIALSGGDGEEGSKGDGNEGDEGDDKKDDDKD